MRRAARTVHAEQRGPVLRNVRRVRRDAVLAGIERAAERGSRQERPRVLQAALHVAGDRAEVPGDVRSPEAREGCAAHRTAPGLVRETARQRPAGGGRAGRDSIRGRGAAGMSARVHQVLATLSYGDAIGNEVLGIQRVLRANGITSDIFVETAHPRLEAATRDYRELPS